MIERSRFMDFEAVRIVNGKNDELTLLTGAGPRIIQFKPGGSRNFFYVKEEDFQDAARKKEEWHIFGGTRLWTSPETSSSYRPDNGPCEVSLDGDTVTASTPVDRDTHLIKSITVEPRDTSFAVTYTIVNVGPHLASAGLWALTCLAPSHAPSVDGEESEGSAIYLPWGEDSAWNVKDMKYWRGWLGAGSDIESTQWRPTNEFFTVRPTGEVGKVGFANRNGFILFRQGELSFIKRSAYVEGALYPDGGCSTEIYTSADFYELETLSPVYLMKPGTRYVHREEWWAGFDDVPVAGITGTKSFADSVLR